MNIGKQKSFTVFSTKTGWMQKDNFYKTKDILFKYKKELIISFLIFAAVLFFLTK